MRLELTTSGLWIQRSNQLSYAGLLGTGFALHFNSTLKQGLLTSYLPLFLMLRYKMEQLWRVCIACSNVSVPSEYTCAFSKQEARLRILLAGNSLVAVNVLEVVIKGSFLFGIVNHFDGSAHSFFGSLAFKLSPFPSSSRSFAHRGFISQAGRGKPVNRHSTGFTIWCK